MSLKRTTLLRRRPKLAEPRERRPAGVTGLGALQPVSSVRMSTADDLQDGSDQVEKENAVRSEKYLAVVRTLRCFSCGCFGSSDACHMNLGKGAGLKVDDRFTFPLCRKCHRDLDQPAYWAVRAKDARRRLEAIYALLTINLIFDAGLWPAGLEPLNAEQFAMLDRWAA